MNRVIKTISFTNGKLHTVKGTQRFLLTDCEATMEIVEHSQRIPILGRGNVIDKRYISMLVTFNHMPNTAIDFGTMESIAFTGDAVRQDGYIETLTFNNCLLVSDLDLTDSGACKFEIQCSKQMMNKLRQL